MDALSDVLKAVRLTGAVFFDIHASEPWVAETPAGRSIVGSIFPEAEHLIPYHVITRGSCWGGVIGEPPLRLSAGDIIVFPHGDSHVMSSAPGMRNSPDMTLYHAPADGQLPFAMAMGGNHADSAHIVCGYLGCDARPFNPLLPRCRQCSASAIGLAERSERSCSLPSPSRRSPASAANACWAA
jgi:Cupin